MIFTEPHTAYKVVEVKDAYGTISSSVNTPFGCFVEEQTKLAYGDNQVIEVGKGVIYTTTSSLTFDTGDDLIIYDEQYVVKSCLKARGIDGEFSHWELTYG